MTEQWTRVAFVKDISPDTSTLRVMYEGTAVCLYAFDDSVCATQDQCPHGNASLAEGYLEDGTIECPLHQGVFNIRTGKPMCPPVTTDLQRYDVRVDAGEVYLRSVQS